MKKRWLIEHYTLYLTPDIISKYFEITPPAIIFDNRICSSCFNVKTNNEDIFLCHAKQTEMENLEQYAFDEMFTCEHFSLDEYFEKYSKLDTEEINEVLNYEPIYFDETRSKVNIEFEN